MAVGLAAATLNGWLDALARNTSYAAAAFWVKLHTADPGAAGATAAFGDATRKQATFGVASGASATTTGDLAWTALSTGGTLTHISFWTASSAGTFLGSAQLTAPKAVNQNDNFTIPTANLTIAITPVAA